jgi:hypothetical protein
VANGFAPSSARRATTSGAADRGAGLPAVRNGADQAAAAASMI